MQSSDPTKTIERLAERTNAHDVDGIVDCFSEEYALESPLHPARSFRGTEQVRRNWTQIFAAVPDLTARIVAIARDGDSVWTEWEMAGRRRDGVAHLMRGIFVFTVRENKIRTGRMFLEMVDMSTTDMDAAVRTTVGVKPS